MNQELVRIMSVDEIEQPGILYTPKKETKKIVIHVHGMDGNFYENRFLDDLAKTYVEKEYAFLTFNNRGRDFMSELIKGDSYIIMGATFERFKDCILDIQGVVDWVKKRGYEDIILEGHSYGCNKVLYYYSQNKKENIKKIILLSPCDVPLLCTKFLSEEECTNLKNEATRLVTSGKDMELIDFPLMIHGKISAGTYYYDFLFDGENDFIKYRDGENGKSEVLRNIDVPVFVIFGDKDECVLTESMEVVRKYFLNNIKDCNIQIIEGADHTYTNKCQELRNVIKGLF